jgi:PhnB protein
MTNRQFNPYLTFSGNCSDAVKFYEKVLGAKVEFLSTFGESPAAETVPPDFQNKIMHAKLLIDGQALMAADAPPHLPNIPMSGFALSINYANGDDARRAFAALSEGGQITMPIEKTFWAEAFGMLTDRFGVPWMINCQAPTA